MNTVNRFYSPLNYLIPAVKHTHTRQINTHTHTKHEKKKQ